MLPYRDEFDVVLCVLDAFFPDDMVGAARALWSHVRPGGRLVVAVFGGEVWTPMLEHFVAEVAQARPDVERVLPW